MTAALDEGSVSGVPGLKMERRRGAGARMLMIHGVLRCGADFSPMLPFLDADLDVTWFDQRGHGGSGRADVYGVKDYVGDALRVVEVLGSEGLTIYGHSLGAMVAAAVAERVPLAGVILEDPPFETMGERIEGTIWQQVFRGFRAALREGAEEGGLLDRLKRIPVRMSDGSEVPLSVLRDEASLRWSAQCLARTDIGVLEPLIEGRWLEGFVWGGLLSRARCPVLVLQGDARSGGALCAEDLEVAGGTAAQVTSIFFEGKGHQLHGTDPERISGLVNRFVNREL